MKTIAVKKGILSIPEIICDTRHTTIQDSRGGGSGGGVGRSSSDKQKPIYTSLHRTSNIITNSINAQLKIKSLDEWKHYLVMIDYKIVKDGERVLLTQQKIEQETYLFFYDYFSLHPYYQEIMFSYKTCIEYIKQLQTIDVLYNAFSIIKHNAIIFQKPNQVEILTNQTPRLIFCDFTNSVDMLLDPYPNIPVNIDPDFSSPFMNVLRLFEKNKWKYNKDKIYSCDLKYITQNIIGLSELMNVSEYKNSTYHDIYCRIKDNTYKTWDVYGVTKVWLSFLSTICYCNKHHTKFVGILNEIISAGGKSPDEVLLLLDYY